MTDYKVISQEYAHGAIKASILINGGAAVALLSQASDLRSAGLTTGIVAAMLLWSFGVLLGASAWVFGFLSTRYYDKHLDEKVEAHLDTSNRLMGIGVLVVGGSLLAFMVGAGAMAASFWPEESRGLTAPQPSTSNLNQLENDSGESVSPD